jgi:hypothetical protein
LDTSLADVERDDFPHTGGEIKEKKSARGIRGGRRGLSEVAHREWKDVDEKDDDGHEETIPRVWLLCLIT